MISSLLPLSSSVFVVIRTTTPVKQPNMHNISILDIDSLTKHVLMTATQKTEVFWMICRRYRGMNYREAIIRVNPQVPKKHLRAKSFLSVAVKWLKSKNFSPFFLIINAELTPTRPNLTTHMSTEFI